MAETIKVEGLKELQRKLIQMPRNIARKHLQKAVNTGSVNVLDLARALVPVDTGFIKANIERRNTNRGMGPFARSSSVGVLSDEKKTGLQSILNVQKVGVKVRVGTTKDGKPKYRYMHSRASRRASANKTGYTGFANADTYYWRFLEFGTSKMPAKPFIRPAFRLSKSAQLGDVRQVLRDALKIEAANS